MKKQVMQDDNFSLLAVTDSADKAYKLIKTGLPDAIIVDLELNEGDGIELLHRLRSPSEVLAVVPYILVVTAFSSDPVMATLTEGLSDYMLRKQNRSYSPEKVLKHLLFMSYQFQRNKKSEEMLIDSSMETEQLVRTRIESELEQYYMSQAASARDYLVECIYRAVFLPPYEQLKIGDIYLTVGKLYRKEPRSIDMAIRRLLVTAFIQTCPSELVEIYGPYVEIGRMAPRNKDFIAYVANKVKKEFVV